jgi:hypothetical protein
MRYLQEKLAKRHFFASKKRISILIASYDFQVSVVPIQVAAIQWTLILGRFNDIFELVKCSRERSFNFKA